ncbi:hypothetical protein OYC64_004267 [Pagothenia borchgrevinki]|uniref:Ig-like domain-containing protein n=1 Tax=Pagothenia borchgrevinki TaxID=8213 RepID=A0ABD2FX26_PAGBO
MVGGCQSCFISVLLLGCFLHDVEASNPQREIHTKVGDTVELSSGLSTEGLTKADWIYEGKKMADKEGAFKNTQFDGRLEFNPANFSLTLKGLTLKDSGEFSFISGKGTGQRPTVIITLYVHEPITKEPIVNSSSTWHTSNASCTVLLECSAATTGHVTYQWTVGTKTFNGFRLQHIIRRQDEDSKFTCTISNVVSEMSTIKTVTCSNTTSPERGKTPLPAGIGFFFTPIVGAGGCLLVAVIVGVAVCVYRHKQSQADSVFIRSQSTNRGPATDHMINQDEIQNMPEYSTLLHGDRCLYETIGGPVEARNGSSNEPEESLYINLAADQ